MNKPEIPTDFKFNTESFYRYGRNKNQWAIGREWQYKGNTYQSIFYGDWSQNTKETWKSYDESIRTEEFKALEKNQSKIIENISDNACANEWREKWDKIKNADKPHDYLITKGITECYETKIDSSGTLLIKIINDTGIMGVQKIYKNKDGGFDKRFSTGLKKKGSFSYIGDFKDAEYIYAAEGFATAASIHEATKLPVIITLDSGNMFHALITVRKINPACKIIICADLDKNKTGEKNAYYCRKNLINTIVRIPKFLNKDDSMTDFNDLAQGDGIGNQLDFEECEFVQVIPLGFYGDNYYYTSTINQQVVKLSSSGHTDKGFLRLATLQYWQKFYAKDGGKPPWIVITSELIKKCHDEGLFSPDKIRGRGVWNDNGKFIINDGDKTPPRSKYFYQKLEKINLDISNPYSDEEMSEILEALKMLRFKNNDDHIYLASWLIQAQIIACLDWRFNIWITGERGSGKSKIMQWIRKAIPISVLSINTTVAGIRQSVKSDAMAVLIDEMEANAKTTGEIIELARQCNSNSEGKTLRGTPEGNAISYDSQCVFMFGSIQVANFNAADASRIFTIEMESTKGQERKEYLKIDRVLSSIKPERLFARAYLALPSILRSINALKEVLSGKDIDSRMADQLATSVACYHAFKTTGDITEKECEYYAEIVTSKDSEFISNNMEDEAEMAMQELLNIVVNVERKTIGDVIEDMDNQYSDQSSNDIILASFGLRYFRDIKELFISNKNTERDKKIPNYPNITKILRRSKELCVVRSKNVCRITKTKLARGVFVKISEPKW